MIEAADAKSRLADVPGWSLDGNALVRDFSFKGFKEAFAFMTSVAALADKMNHHPDWSNVYNKVSIRLSTHSAGGLTDLDFDLAGRINQLASINN